MAPEVIHHLMIDNIQDSRQQRQQQSNKDSFILCERRVTTGLNSDLVMFDRWRRVVWLLCVKTNAKSYDCHQRGHLTATAATGGLKKGFLYDASYSYQ
jgi:hypothetical protein